MALSDSLPQPIPTATLATYDPPAYIQHHASETSQYSLNNNNGKETINNLKTITFGGIISPEEEEQQLPCHQYKEFLDASHHERTDMIDNLVDVSVDIINSIWPTPTHVKVVNTKGFICEILKRSKTTYFMLQLSLFYIFRVKRVVQSKLRMKADERRYQDDLMCCGRRMFLASLMVASKYINDKSYRNKAWADASGLTLAEINASELAFLQMIDYRLYVSKPTFEKWYDMLNQRLKQRKQQHIGPQQQQKKQPGLQHQRSYPQQYNHHHTMSPHSIKKPSVKMTATMNGNVNMKAIKTATMMATTAHHMMTQPPVTLSPSPPTTDTVPVTTHYPSPSSPCYYQPNINTIT
ncbi:cyclin-domain-containing protein [Chlamydoabsidia padenii]|nr:cyclin-domain-containing protein [Chlamydoabsidia padenii]